MISDDSELRKYIMAHLEEFKLLGELTVSYEQGKAKVLAEYEEEMQPVLGTISVLQERTDEVWVNAEEYIDRKALEGIKTFLDGMVKVQTRRRVLEYIPEEVDEWARKRFKDLFTLPEDKGRIEEAIEVLREHAPHLLDIDTKKAAKRAIELTGTGARKYPSAPVQYETYTTKPSDDTKRKVIGTLSIEKDVDDRA